VWIQRIDPEFHRTVTPLLIEALEDPDSSPNGVRDLAVRTLARIGSASTTSEELFRTVERALEPLARENSNRGGWVQRRLSDMQRSREVRAGFREPLK